MILSPLFLNETAYLMCLYRVTFPVCIPYAGMTKAVNYKRHENGRFAFFVHPLCPSCLCGSFFFTTMTQGAQRFHKAKRPICPR